MSTKRSTASGDKGNMQFICNLCHTQFSSSHAHVKAHLLHICRQGIRSCNEVNKNM